MTERQRLKQQRDDAQKRWDSLSEMLGALREEHDRETRADEKLRLKPKIAACESEREAVEDELRKLEDELRKRELVHDARRMERNRFFEAALRTWEEIRELEPDYPGIAREIERLTEKDQLARRLREANRRLPGRIPEIKELFVPITRRLIQLGDTTSEPGPYLSLVESFLEGELDPGELREMWTELESGPEPGLSEGPDYPALADRLERGELVLFLGSDVPSLFDAEALDSQGLAAALARRVDYDELGGSLATISEYYEISEHGKPSLVRNLAPLLPAPPVAVPLYSTLARVRSPLVVLSTSYDTLLERAFLDAGKPFAVVTPLVSSSAGYEVGSLLVRYSDRDGHEILGREPGPSQLGLVDAGYTLIYKVRGCVDEGTDQDPRRQDALTLSEESYFTFAAAKDQLIPSFVVKQFAGRGFLLLGCVPRQWEDRLILGAILDKRRHAETPFTVRKEVDRFENAYWVRRRVRRYAIDLREFVESLEVHLD